jgi:HprK-related kinase A
MTTSFVLDSAPFNFQVTTSGSALQNQLRLLYPTSILKPATATEIVDFQIDFKRNWFSFSQSYAFKLGQHHFRMTAKPQLLSVFEWGLNWAVSSYQNRYLCIHAAVLEKNGISLILPAPPGSGKSTLCALLMLSGWRLLSDEHCLVDPETGLIFPFVRPISLKNRSIAVLNQRYGQNIVQSVVPDTFKGTIGYLPPTDESWQLMRQPVQPCYVIFPKYNAAVTATEFSGIAQSQLFMQLAVNCFNYTVLAEIGFATLGQLVKQVVGIRLEYADTDEALRLISELD